MLLYYRLGEPLNRLVDEESDRLLSTHVPLRYRMSVDGDFVPRVASLHLAHDPVLTLLVGNVRLPCWKRDTDSLSRCQSSIFLK